MRLKSLLDMPQHAADAESRTADPVSPLNENELSAAE
jgi:hypothetical protein